MNGGISGFGFWSAVVTAALAYKAHRTRAAATAAEAPASASDSTQQPAAATVSVSAPGKVLVTGGYLVLRSLPGLTLSTTARFHSAATWAGGDGDADDRLATLLRQLQRSDAATTDECVTVVVESPQMWTKWTYRLQCCHPFSLTSVDGKRNKFVERAMQCALQVFAHVGPKGRLESLLRAASIAKLTLHLRLVADNDFYSQRDQLVERGLEVNATNLAKLPQHLPCRRDASGAAIVAKTGMGSSAALVTSLVGCLASFLRVATLPGDKTASGRSEVASGGVCEADVDRSVRLVHHVAQVAHALAQGKVGSGFDVSSAALGSQRYIRVPAETLKGYLDRLDTEDDAKVAAVAAELAASRVADWDYHVTPFALPRGFELMMADVCGGSETPSMVRKILAWKKAGEGGAADELWTKLGKINDEVEHAFAQLRSLADEDSAAYDTALLECASTTGDKWEVAGAASTVAAALAQLRAAFRATRVCLKLMGEKAGVPVEPDEQTAFADGTLQVPGVVAAGVPGAGGYDALYAVILSGVNGATRAAVGEFWSETSGNMVCPLLLTAEAGFGSGAGVRID